VPPSRPLTPATLLGLLADDDRRRVVAALVLGARTQRDLRDAAALEPKALARAVGRLRAAGLVLDEADGTLTFAAETFATVAREAAEVEAAAAAKSEQPLDASPEAALVLRNFVSNGRLQRMPAQHAKRLVVLDWLSNRFEPGRIYPEREVNDVLLAVYDDPAAARRYLVDEEFLERRDGFYWRAGGTFDIE
jgi:hypothetical protein